MKKIKTQQNKNILILSTCIIIYIVFFFTLSVLRYKSFFSYEWEDQAEVNTLVWNIAHGNFFNHIKALSQSPDFFIHIMPIYFFLGILYHLAPHIYTTFFLISFTLAISSIPIFQISAQILKNKKAALLLALGYLFYAPKNALIFLDGDPSILAIPFLLFAFSSVLKGKGGHFIFWSVLTMLCKTETPMYIAFLILYLFLRRKKFNKIKSKTYIQVGFVSIFMLFLNFFLYWIQKSNFCDSCQNEIFLKFSLSQNQIQSFIKIFTPVFGFPLLSPEVLMGIPSIFFIASAENFVYQRAHYISNLIPFIFIGTIFTIQRSYTLMLFLNNRILKGKTKNYDQNKWFIFASILILTGCIFSNFNDNIIGGTYPASFGEIKDRRFISSTNMYDKKFYEMDEEDKIAWKFIRLIPSDPNISVAASGDLLVPLSSRKKILQFLDTQYDYYNVDYILIHNKNMYMGAGHYVWDDERMQRELSALLDSPHWDRIAIQGAFFLFKRKNNNIKNTNQKIKNSHETFR